MRYLGFTLLLLILFASCSQEERKQFEYSGGCLTMALEYEPSTYVPRLVTDYYSATVLNQISEGLVGFDPESMKVEPRIAESWTKSDDGLQYTFTLRKDVYFHPHEIFGSKEDRLLTAEDVVSSFEKACTLTEEGLEPSSYTMAFKGCVKGADDFLSNKAKSISGISTKDNVITIDLIHEDHNFLYKLANINLCISPSEFDEIKYKGEIIGTGPFICDTYTAGDPAKLLLLKNQDYYETDAEGNALPYLDSLVFVFQSRKMEQLDLFETGELDLIIGLPTSRITRMLEGRIEDFNSKPPKLVLANNPLLESNFYFFNLNDERFKDVRVRQAFNYAIDKETIGREILRNQYYDLGEYGITPPIGKVLRGYDFNVVKKAGYTYDPEKARKLLAEAGYPNGEGFGTINLRYNIDDVHSAVADEFSKQIFKVLNINVNIDGSSFDQLNKDGVAANGDIFRMGWAADYPSPESFLMNFYGKNVPSDPSTPSPINKSRYLNPNFDNLYEQAVNSQKLADQMKFFSLAEAELLKDPPIIPLWYTGDIEITQSYVRDFHFNAINYIAFKSVYIKEWTAEEFQAAHSQKE